MGFFKELDIELQQPELEMEDSNKQEEILGKVIELLAIYGPGIANMKEQIAKLEDRVNDLETWSVEIELEKENRS